MQPNPTNANPATDRPDTFDSAVLAYLPALKKLAHKLTNGNDEREELVQDTLAYVFDKWRNFRADPTAPKSGMYNWLTLTMRSIAQAKRRRQTPAYVDLAEWHMAASLSEPARQEDIIDAETLMRRLSYTREGRMLARYAKGETLEQIGKRRKIGKERVRQLIERARARVVKVAA